MSNFQKNLKFKKKKKNPNLPNPTREGTRIKKSILRGLNVTTKYHFKVKQDNDIPKISIRIFMSSTSSRPMIGAYL